MRGWRLADRLAIAVWLTMLGLTPGPGSWLCWTGAIAVLVGATLEWRQG